MTASHAGARRQWDQLWCSRWSRRPISVRSVISALAPGVFLTWMAIGRGSHHAVDGLHRSCGRQCTRRAGIGAAAETRSHSRADAGRTETGRTADTETPTSPAKTRTKGVAPAGGVAGATARYGSGGKSRTPNTVTLPGMNATPDTHRIPRTRVAQPQIVKIFADRSGFVATFPRMTLPINAGGEYKQRQELRTPPAVPTRGLDRLRPSQGQPRALLDVTSARLVTRAECELHDFSAVDACAHLCPPSQGVAVHRSSVVIPFADSVSARSRRRVLPVVATARKPRADNWPRPVPSPILATAGRPSARRRPDHERKGAAVSATSPTLANLLHEQRRFDPPPELAANAIATASIYEEAARDRLAFWAAQAERLTWATPWEQVLDWSDAPFARWFVGGRLNAAVNCLDRHVAAGYGGKVAFYWEGEPGDTRVITYAELTAMVCQAANALTELGVTAGDRVMIYMPMIPETVVAMLACARIGAVQSVVFGGFSAEALAGRTNDAQARLIITADGGFRRGAAHALKPAVDDACAQCPQVDKVLVVRRTGQDIPWNDGRDIWWHDIVDRQPSTHEAQAFDAEHPLYIMYTSGTTAKPKGILHTTGGYLTGVTATHRMVFDLHEDTDLYWCGADIGWVTGHSYIVYGPLANRA